MPALARTIGEDSYTRAANEDCINGGARTGTKFLYDGDALVGEYNDAGALQARYVHGAGVDEPLVWYTSAALGATGRYYLFGNHQGSVVAIANSSGAKTAINTYSPYGAASASLPNTGRFQYTGQILIPQAGLYYYKARMYSAGLGRFMQTDPIGYKDDMDLYTYVANDSVDGRDPSGNAEENDAIEEKEAEKMEEVIVTGRAIRGLVKDIQKIQPGFSMVVSEDYEYSQRDVDFLQAELKKLREDALCSAPAENSESQNRNDATGRNPADDQKLSPGEIIRLDRGGENAEALKGRRGGGQRDLYKDKLGNIYIKPKGGAGPGEPTGLNIKDF